MMTGKRKSLMGAAILAALILFNFMPAHTQSDWPYIKQFRPSPSARWKATEKVLKELLYIAIGKLEILPEGAEGKAKTIEEAVTAYHGNGPDAAAEVISRWILSFPADKVLGTWESFAIGLGSWAFEEYVLKACYDFTAGIGYQTFMEKMRKNPNQDPYKMVKDLHDNLFDRRYWKSFNFLCQKYVEEMAGKELEFHHFNVPKYKKMDETVLRAVSGELFQEFKYIYFHLTEKELVQLRDQILKKSGRYVDTVMQELKKLNERLEKGKKEIEELNRKIEEWEKGDAEKKPLSPEPSRPASEEQVSISLPPEPPPPPPAPDKPSPPVLKLNEELVKRELEIFALEVEKELAMMHGYGEKNNCPAFLGWLDFQEKMDKMYNQWKLKSGKYVYYEPLSEQWTQQLADHLGRQSVAYRQKKIEAEKPKYEAEGRLKEWKQMRGMIDSDRRRFESRLSSIAGTYGSALDWYYGCLLAGDVAGKYGQVYASLQQMQKKQVGGYDNIRTYTDKVNDPLPNPSFYRDWQYPRAEQILNEWKNRFMAWLARNKLTFTAHDQHKIELVRENMRATIELEQWKKQRQAYYDGLADAELEAMARAAEARSRAAFLPKFEEKYKDVRERVKKDVEEDLAGWKQNWEKCEQWLSNLEIQGNAGQFFDRQQVRESGFYRREIKLDLDKYFPGVKLNELFAIHFPAVTAEIPVDWSEDKVKTLVPAVETFRERIHKWRMENYFSNADFKLNVFISDLKKLSDDLAALLDKYADYPEIWDYVRLYRIEVLGDGAWMNLPKEGEHNLLYGSVGIHDFLRQANHTYYHKLFPGRKAGDYDQRPQDYEDMYARHDSEWPYKEFSEALCMKLKEWPGRVKLILGDKKILQNLNGLLPRLLEAARNEQNVVLIVAPPQQEETSPWTVPGEEISAPQEREKISRQAEELLNALREHYEREERHKFMSLVSAEFFASGANALNYDRLQMALQDDFQSLNNIRLTLRPVITPREDGVEIRVGWDRRAQIQMTGHEWTLQGKETRFLFKTEGEELKLAGMSGDRLFGLADQMGSIQINEGKINLEKIAPEQNITIDQGKLYAGGTEVPPGQIPGAASEITGNAVLEANSVKGWDFSSNGPAMSPVADLYCAWNDPNQTLTDGPEPGTQVKVGTIDYDAATYLTLSAMTYVNLTGLGGVAVSLGDGLAIKTYDGHYAKIKVTNIVPGGFDVGSITIIFTYYGK